METRKYKGKSFVLLTKPEFAALAACTRVLTRHLGEDVIGAFTHTFGSWILNGTESVRLADAIEHAKLPGPIEHYILDKKRGT